MNIKWLLSALVLACALAIAHRYALAHFLYWEYRWIDIPMHMLGGVVIATFSIGLLGTYRPYLLLAVIASVFIGWEIFEYIAKISTGQPDYVFDTAHDIVNDFIGATVAFLVAKKSLWHSA